MLVRYKLLLYFKIDCCQWILLPYLHDCGQAAYLDMDTLWLDTPTRLNAEFQRMENYQQFFGMAVETTDKNGNASWYRGGKPRKLHFAMKIAPLDNGSVFTCIFLSRLVLHSMAYHALPI